MRDILKPLQIARKAYHMIYYERAAKSLVFPWAEKRVEEYTNQKVIEELDRLITNVNSNNYIDEFDAIQGVADYVRNRQEELKQEI